MNNFFLVIPVFNEQGRIEAVVSKAKKHVRASRIVVVDDGSRVPLNLKGVHLLRHPLNIGKGAALKTGIEYAFAQGAKAVIMMDGDGQHDPDDLPQFIKHLEGGFDVVFASRRPNLTAPLVRLLGNKFASIYINVLYGVYVADILSGYRALTLKAYKKINWQSTRYGVETEMVARLGKYRKQLKFIEFPIETVYIDKYKGVTILDAIKILFDSLWWKLS
jgi:dolichol-phosphate mannosyltransferase